jgi:prophage regulatory protein
MSNRLIRLPKVMDRSGLSRSTIYNHMGRGIFPAPIRCGKRLNLWPEDEVTAINSARIAGKSDDEIKSLVSSLIAQREEAAA